MFKKLLVNWEKLVFFISIIILAAGVTIISNITAGMPGYIEEIKSSADEIEKRINDERLPSITIKKYSEIFKNNWLEVEKENIQPLTGDSAEILYGIFYKFPNISWQLSTTTTTTTKQTIQIQKVLCKPVLNEPVAEVKKISLSWSLKDPTPGPNRQCLGAKKYIVYRRKSDEKDFSQIATINNETYDDTAVEEGTTYFYYVAVVVDNEAGKEETAKSDTLETATQTSVEIKECLLARKIGDVLEAQLRLVSRYYDSEQKHLEFFKVGNEIEIKVKNPKNQLETVNTKFKVSELQRVKCKDKYSGDVYKYKVIIIDRNNNEIVLFCLDPKRDAGVTCPGQKEK